MGERLIVTPVLSQRGRREFWLWEYDLSRPRDPEAADIRQHYAVKRLVGVFPTSASADAAIPA
jgi:hypothetical protein